MPVKQIIRYTILSIALLSTIVCSTRPVVKMEEVKTQVIPDDTIPPVKAMVIEIVEEKGVQKYIYIKQGESNKWYRKGLIGDIYNDVAMKEKCGTFEVVDIYKKFSKGKVLELSYTINKNAVVLVEVDPRKK